MNTSALRASFFFVSDPDLTVGAITCRRFAPLKTRGAGDSIKPGVKRSGTPGTDLVNGTSPGSGRQLRYRTASGSERVKDTTIAQKGFES
jgi:hypothetical protein